MQTQPGVNHRHTWICATGNAAPIQTLMPSVFVFVSKVSAKLVTEHAIKKYLYKRNPVPPPRHSTACLEFPVPTILLLSKQFIECLCTYKPSLLLFTLALGWKQLDFWLLTGFCFPGYYYVDSFAMQEAGMPYNIKSTAIKIPHENITL